MKKQVYFLLIFVLLAGSIVDSFAEDAFIKSCGADEVIFSTGVVGNTYSAATQPVKTLVPGVICERTDSTGGAQNVQLLLGLGGDAEAAIVPTDVLDYMARTNPDVKKLRSIMSLWGNALHIIASANGYQKITKGRFRDSKETVYIQDFRDLRGLKIGVFGSPVISARVIDERLKMNFDIDDKIASFDAGLVKLEKDEIQAFMIMGGYPVKNVENLDPKKFVLVNVDTATVTALGEPYYATKINYPKQGANGFSAITSKNEIIVRDYQSPKWIQRYGKLYHAIKDNLQELQEMRGAHPAWKIVSDVDRLYWQPYSHLKEITQDNTAQAQTAMDVLVAQPVQQQGDIVPKKKVKKNN
jgi:TRAP-type uncharacterized transport system substrate-binding protein